MLEFVEIMAGIGLLVSLTQSFRMARMLPTPTPLDRLVIMLLGPGIGFAVGIGLPLWYAKAHPYDDAVKSWSYFFALVGSLVGSGVGPIAAFHLLVKQRYGSLSQAPPELAQKLEGEKKVNQTEGSRMALRMLIGPIGLFLVDLFTADKSKAAPTPSAPLPGAVQPPPVSSPIAAPRAPVVPEVPGFLDRSVNSFPMGEGGFYLLAAVMLAVGLAATATAWPAGPDLGRWQVIPNVVLVVCILLPAVLAMVGRLHPFPLISVFLFPGVFAVAAHQAQASSLPGPLYLGSMLGLLADRLGPSVACIWIIIGLAAATVIALLMLAERGPRIKPLGFRYYRLVMTLSVLLVFIDFATVQWFSPSYVILAIMLLVTTPTILLQVIGLLTLA